MNPAPEITITVAVAPSSVSSHEGDSDYARWETEQSPCFPRPLCVALPPKRPDRQASVATTSGGDNNNNKSCGGVDKPKPQKAPPKIPRRRVSAARVNKMTMDASPPQRPARQESAGKLLPHLPCMDDFQRLPSAGASTLTEDSLDFDTDDDDESCSDEELSLTEQMEGSLVLEGSSSRFHSQESTGSQDSRARDLSPARPTRQRTAFDDEEGVPALASSGSENSFAKAASSDDSNKPEWVKLWESQGEGNATDFANLWMFEGDDE